MSSSPFEEAVAREQAAAKLTVNPTTPQQAVQVQNGAAQLGMPADVAAVLGPELPKAVETKQVNDAMVTAHPAVVDAANQSGEQTGAVLKADIPGFSSLANNVQDYLTRTAKGIDTAVTGSGTGLFQPAQDVLRGAEALGGTILKPFTAPVKTNTSFLDFLGQQAQDQINLASAALSLSPQGALFNFGAAAASAQAGRAYAAIPGAKYDYDAAGNLRKLSDGEAQAQGQNMFSTALFGIAHKVPGTDVAGYVPRVEGQTVGGPAAPGPTGIHTEDGFVSDAEGNVASFRNVREAAKWNLENAQGEGSQAEKYNYVNNSDGSVSLKLRDEPSIEGDPPPGGSDQADAMRAPGAAVDLENAEAMQHDIASSPIMPEAPHATSDFINSLAPDSIVTVPAEAVEDHPEFLGKLVSMGKVSSASAQAMMELGHPLEIDAGTYHAAVAGAPWANELNKKVEFEGNISAQDAVEAVQRVAEPRVPPPKDGEGGAVDLDKTFKALEDTFGRTPSEVEMSPAYQKLFKTLAGSPEAAVAAAQRLSTEHLPLAETHAVKDAVAFHAMMANETNDFGLDPKDEAIIAKVASDPQLAEVPEALDEFVKAAQALKKQVAYVTKSQYLSQVFASGKALATSKPLFVKWSQQLKDFQRAAYEKALNKLYEKLKAKYSKEFKDRYNEVFPAIQDKWVTRPDVMARLKLQEGMGGGTDITVDNAFAPGGKPTVFYHSGHNLTVGTAENPWRAINYDGISFSEDPQFAIKYHHLDNFNPFSSYDTGGITYIVHLKAKPGQLADFRNPDDVAKAFAWYKQHGRADEETLRQLKNGSYPLWEHGPMLKANGWTASRMVERSNTTGTELWPKRETPNAFVLSGDQVHFVYSPETGNLISKLDLGEKDKYPKELIDGLPRNIFQKGGITADAAAVQLGYTSGEELLNALAGGEAARKASGKSFKNWMLDQIKAEAQAQALSDTGVNLDPQSLMEEAKAGVQEASPKDLLIDQLRQMAEALGKPLTKEDVIKAAEDSFDALPMKEAVNARKFAKVMYHAGRAFERAMVQKGDLVAAFKAKQNHTMAYLHMEMARLAQNELRRFDNAIKGLRTTAGPPGEMNPDVAAILQGELASHGVPLARKLDELAGYIKARGAEGGLQTLQDVTEAAFLSGRSGATYDPLPGGTTYSDALHGDFSQYSRMMRILVKFGHDIGFTMNEAKRESIDAIGDELLENVNLLSTRDRESINQEYNRRQGKNPLKKADIIAGDLISAQIRPEVKLGPLDKFGYGPLRQLVIDPLQEGKYTETDLSQGYIQRLLAADPTGEWRRSLEQTLPVNENLMARTPDGHYITVLNNRADLVGAFIHLGNEVSKNKMLRGFGWEPAAGQDMSSQEQWIIANVTPKDVEMSKLFWEENARLYPLANQLQMDVEGVGLEQNPGREITMPNGTKVMGGHVHLDYRKDLYNMWGIADKQDAEQQYAAARLPGASYTNRYTAFNGPMKLNYTSLADGIMEVIHNIAFRRAMIDAQAIINNDKVGLALQLVYGSQAQMEMQQWLSFIAKEKSINPIFSTTVGLMDGFQRNMIASLIGFNPRTLFLHGGIGALHVRTLIGDDSALGSAMHDLFVGDSQDEWDKFTKEKFGEVRNSIHYTIQSVNESMQTDALAIGWGPKYREIAYHLLTSSKMAEAKIVALAVYRQTMERTGDEAQAVSAANQAVRDSQGAAHAVDLPALYRKMDQGIGRMLQIMFTQLQTFKNLNDNRAFTIAMQYKYVQGILGTDYATEQDAVEAENLSNSIKKDMRRKFIGYFVFTALFYALYEDLHDALRGQLTPGKIAGNLLTGSFEQTLGSVAVVNNIMNSILGRPFVESPFDSAFRAAEDIREHKHMEQVLLDAARGLAMFIGVPQTGINIPLGAATGGPLGALSAALGGQPKLNSTGRRRGGRR